MGSSLDETIPSKGRRMRCATGALLLFTLIAAIAVPAAHGGGSYAVNDTRDASDGLPGDGKCETAPLSEVCTLRAAVEEGNASEGTTTVVLPGGVYSLAKTGDLPSRRSLTL